MDSEKKDGVDNPIRLFTDNISPPKLSFLVKLREDVAPTLNNNILRHFTYHDIGHSDRMTVRLWELIKKNLQAGNEQSLTENELFLLLSSFYLHDISLQVPKAHGITFPVEDFTNTDYDLIRINHGEVSAEIIMEMITKKSDPYDLNINLKKYPNLLPSVAEICSKHQSRFSFKINETLDYEGKIRIGLLISLLRIVDQLDCDHNRVDMTKLSQYSISPNSMVHWITCHYIDSVETKNGKIRIIGSFPDELDPPEIECICKQLASKVEAELTEEVIDFLWDNNIPIQFNGRIINQSRDYTIPKIVPDSNIRELIRNEIEIHEPKYVENIKQEDNKKKNWMTYWNLIGDPFRDEPLSYGSKHLVETEKFSEIISEIGTLIQAKQGDLKLIIGERGLGKTTLFKVIKGAFIENYNVKIIDVADIVQRAKNAADLYQALFSRTSFQIFGKEDEDFDKGDFLENLNRGNNRIICIDSLDRGSQDKDPIIKEFFRISQHILTSSKGNNILILSCSDRWKGFLDSTDLSYLSYKNQWMMEAFNTSEARNMLDKRLMTAGRKFTDIFTDDCITPLHAMSGGNPRKILGNAGNACRLAFQRKEENIDVNFLMKEYREEYGESQRVLLEEQCLRSPLFRDGLKSLFSYYSDIERRNLDADIGSSYITQMIEGELKKKDVDNRYFIPMKLVATIFQQMDNDKKITTYIAQKDVKKLFSILKSKGYKPKDFLALYIIDPFIPPEDFEGISTKFKKHYESSDEIKYYEQARIEYIDTTKNVTTPYIYIRKSWDALENLIVAILIKEGRVSSQYYISKNEEAFYYDHLDRKRYKRGGGRVLSDLSQELVEKLKELTKSQPGTYLYHLPSVQWIRHERNNIIKGQSGSYTKYDEKSLEICKNHLELGFKELLELYEHTTTTFGNR